MVQIKFSSHPCVAISSPIFSPMAFEGSSDSSKADKGTVGKEEPNISTGLTSKPDIGSEESNASGDTGDSGNASDDGGRVKIRVEACLVGVSFDFGQSKVTRGRILDLKSSSQLFPKGSTRPPGIESVPAPREDEAVVFEDFFIAGLRIPPHPVLLSILHKFQVQLHQFSPNAIVQICNFIWAITSCWGHSNAEVFTHNYELHYQNKKIHLEGSETKFIAQFGSISFHPSRFGNRARLTPAMRNKWTSGWDGHWFYCRVPLVEGKDFKGPRTYPLSSQTIRLTYEMDASSSCDFEDADFKAFVDATSLIGGLDAVEEFLARDLSPLGRRFGFLVETKESPLSKIILPMPQISTAIAERESPAKFVACIEKASNELVFWYNLAEHNAYQGLRHG
jgi:hypothetical protein